jgi:aryl-alcohol dehydrogenase-like predicted oxidoreductase
MKKCKLGNTGITVSSLGIGTGTHGIRDSSAQTRKGAQWLSKLLIKGYGMGISFWDLADQYGSHIHAQKALHVLSADSFDRHDLVICTKTTATTYQECKTNIKRFLNELGTEYIDIVLLHCTMQGNWPKSSKGAMKALDEAKAEGKIRAVGISSHAFEALQTAASDPWTEIVFARLNYTGDNMDAPPEKVIPVLRKARLHGKAVIAMKVIGCGTLSNDPQKAISYVQNLDCVDAIVIGFLKESEMKSSLVMFD